MFTRFLSSFLCFLFLGLFSSLSHAAPLKVRGAILMDFDRVKVIYRQNDNKKIPPASLTKIMTMYLVFDAIKAKKISLKTKVKVSRHAARTGGSSMHLKAGDIVTVEQLLYGMAVASGNDACVAIAEHLAGSEKKFIMLMNQKARKLEMRNTTFKTTNGLPANGQFTTANDMLALSRNYIFKHPESLRYHSTKNYYYHRHKLKNNNPQLGKYKGADGLKTGWTIASGYNIVSTGRRGKTRLIAVILGAGTAQIRAKELNRLMDAGYKLQKNKNRTVKSLL